VSELDVITDGTRRTTQRLICADCVYQSRGLLLPVFKYYSTQVLQLLVALLCLLGLAWNVFIDMLVVVTKTISGILTGWTHMNFCHVAT